MHDDTQHVNGPGPCGLVVKGTDPVYSSHEAIPGNPRLHVHLYVHHNHYILANCNIPYIPSMDTPIALCLGTTVPGALIIRTR